MGKRKPVNDPARSSEPVPKLSEDAQIFAVTALALWRPTAEILKALAEEYGTPISAPALWHYDPRSPNCPERWRLLHAETRKSYVERVADLPGANKAWRLDELYKLFQGAVASGNKVLAKDLLKQIAEDSGDVYTKTREFTGPGGSPLLGGATLIDGAALLASIRGEAPAPVQPAPLVPEDPSAE